MAGIIGTDVAPVIYGFTNANLSAELNELTNPVPFLDYYDIREQQVAIAFSPPYRIATDNSWGIIGEATKSFKDDFYERIHITPNRIDLGTVANTVSRDISVWNAYTTQDATLADVSVFNGSGISVTGDALPFVFAPLQERLWTVTVTPNGPPEINAELLFDFTGVTDPLPVVITGNRAVVLPITPEIPVKETWKWLTDVQVTYGGVEQRIGLRKVPRRSMSTQMAFETEAEAREQYRILLSALGRLFIPYFQYSSIIAADANAGDSVLVFDTAKVDLRDEDYVLIIGKNFARLVQLDAIGSNSATTQSPLSADIPKGSRVVSIFASILPNNLTLQRPAVNNRATMSLSSTATYPRATHQRPGSTATLNSLAGFPILERRPLANDDLEYEFDTGQENLDAETGLFDVSTNWDFTKVESQFQFKVRRLGVDMCSGLTGSQEMDYWRLFTDEMKGSLNNFLLSTYRPDQILAADVGLGSNSMIFVGPSYADNFWPAIPYHFLAITTEAGVHYAQVTGANKNIDGDSSISFTPALPSSPGWNNIVQVSYLLKQRIVDDTVELEHHAFDTFFSFRARTIPE